MPILHVQFAAQASQPAGGTPDDVPPAIALQQRGPIVQVNVSLEQSFAQGLLSQGKPIPPAESGFALIDTGASHTCIDDEVAKRLNLPVIDVAMMTSASHTATQQSIYPVQIDIIGMVGIASPRTMGANLAPQGLLLLIGRDVLMHGLLIYNGATGQITFSI